MTEIPSDLPVVPLPGSENWRDAHEWGRALDRQFPDQDAMDFAYACHYNTFGPMHSGDTILELVMMQEGERDAENWVWRVTLEDGEIWFAEAGCDYTGWDCQSWIEWHYTWNMDRRDV